MLQYAADKFGNEAAYPRDLQTRADINRWLRWEGSPLPVRIDPPGRSHHSEPKTMSLRKSVRATMQYTLDNGVAPDYYFYDPDPSVKLNPPPGTGGAISRRWKRDRPCF